MEVDRQKLAAFVALLGMTVAALSALLGQGVAG
jgi:hypothetical protein